MRKAAGSDGREGIISEIFKIRKGAISEWKSETTNFDGKFEKSN